MLVDHQQEESYLMCRVWVHGLLVRLIVLMLYTLLQPPVLDKVLIVRQQMVPLEYVMLVPIRVLRIQIVTVHGLLVRLIVLMQYTLLQPPNLDKVLIVQMQTVLLEQPMILDHVMA